MFDCGCDGKLDLLQIRFPPLNQSGRTSHSLLFSRQVDGIFLAVTGENWLGDSDYVEYDPTNVSWGNYGLRDYCSPQVLKELSFTGALVTVLISASLDNHLSLQWHCNQGDLQEN